ncbi:MAG: hypothetical protein ACI9EF_003458 [Pseudohongiellaceae bacterium]|jgi:hypothetical protein
MRTALTLAALCLAVVVAWWSLDDVFADAVSEQAVTLGLAEQLSFGAVESDLPHGVALIDVVLRDAASGREVVQLGRADFELRAGWNDGLDVELMAVNGVGGRISIEPTKDGLGGMVDTLIDVIVAIVETLEAASTPGEPRGALPPLLFRDLDVVVLADSWPLENYQGSRVLVAQNGDAVEATIDFGGGGGRLVLRFGPDGLDRIDTVALALTPGIVRLIGDPWGPLLARLARPRGLADLVITRLDQELPDVHGVVREGVIDSPWVPLPLGPLTLPLELTAGELKVTTEPWPFENGTMKAQIEGNADALTLVLSIRDGDFHEGLLSLVPAYGQQQVLRCGDGGKFDLDLTLAWDFERGATPHISGSGGFHVQTMTLPEFGLTLEDVVGRLQVVDDRLRVPEVTGLCADGGFSGVGELDLVDSRFQVDVDLKELNISALQESLAPELAATSPLAGWLAGRLHCEGDLDRVDLVQGQGEFFVRAGRFAESRALTLIRQALTLGPTEQRNDQRLQAELRYGKEILTVERISVDLGLLALTGQGQVDANGVVDLDLLLMKEPAGFLGSLWGFIQKSLIVQVDVTGPVDEVEVAVYPLGVISRPLQAAMDFLTAWRDEEP